MVSCARCYGELQMEVLGAPRDLHKIIHLNRHYWTIEPVSARHRISIPALPSKPLYFIPALPPPLTACWCDSLKNAPVLFLSRPSPMTLLVLTLHIISWKAAPLLHVVLPHSCLLKSLMTCFPSLSRVNGQVVLVGRRKGPLKSKTLLNREAAVIQSLW